MPHGWRHRQKQKPHRRRWTPPWPHSRRSRAGGRTSRGWKTRCGGMNSSTRCAHRQGRSASGWRKSEATTIRRAPGRTQPRRRWKLRAGNCANSRSWPWPPRRPGTRRKRPCSAARSWRRWKSSKSSAPSWRRRLTPRRRNTGRRPRPRRRRWRTTARKTAPTSTHRRASSRVRSCPVSPARSAAQQNTPAPPPRRSRRRTPPRSSARFQTATGRRKRPRSTAHRRQGCADSWRPCARRSRRLAGH